MLELIHAVIASLLLSTVAGGGVDQTAQTDEEPGSSETGIDVGKMPSHLVSPRGLANDDQSDDHQPTAMNEQVSFCEPAVWAPLQLTTIQNLPQAVPFQTAGRSP